MSTVCLCPPQLLVLTGPFLLSGLSRHLNSHTLHPSLTYPENLHATSCCPLLASAGTCTHMVDVLLCPLQGPTLTYTLPHSSLCRYLETHAHYTLLTPAAMGTHIPPGVPCPLPPDLCMLLHSHHTPCASIHTGPLQSPGLSRTSPHMRTVFISPL